MVVRLTQSLFDEMAYPQRAEWCRRRVARVLRDRIDDDYRVWFTDHAKHQDPAVMPRIDIHPHHSIRIINYGGVHEQALRDLAAWVERGIAPPPSTCYELVDGQIVLAATAAARREFQPVVELLANGAERTEVAVSEPVSFSALVEVPPGTGTIVAAEWDFGGAGGTSRGPSRSPTRTCPTRRCGPAACTASARGGPITRLCGSRRTGSDTSTNPMVGS